MSDKGNLNVSYEKVIGSSVDSLWQILGNFNGLDQWHPAVSGSELTGDGTSIGDVRVLTLADGATITETLRQYDDSNRHYSYTIEDSPLPVSNYHSTIALQAVDDASTKVTWQSSFDAQGADDAEAKEIILGIYQAGLDSL